MRRAGILVGVFLAMGALASTGSARNPKLEKLALAPADMRLASSALLRKADFKGIAPGWVRLSTTPDNSGPICPWQDYSDYTLTGQGEADFQPTKVGRAGFVGATIDIFATPADALGKFTNDSHAGTATCEGEALRKALGGSKLKPIVERQLADPSLGEHAVAYEFGYLQPAGTPKRIYIHVIEFVRGRAVGAVLTTDFDAPGDMATRLRLAGLMDGRLK